MILVYCKQWWNSKIQNLDYKIPNPFTNNTLTPTIKTKRAVTLLIPLADNFFKLIRIPNCPPNKTATIKQLVSTQGSESELLVINPKSPEIEFTKIKKLASAAIFMALSHFRWFKTGAKNIPPPIPTNPDKNPIPPPKR